MREYDGRLLTNVVVTYKVDGVCAVNTNGTITSRSGKPLYNVIAGGWSIAEVFLGTWEKTVSAVRTHCGTPVAPEHIYTILPIDERLVLVRQSRVDSAGAMKYLAIALNQGYEGIVYHSDQGLFKHKPTCSFDVPVIGYVEGKGRLVGKLGKYITPLGGVGTGFTDKQRAEAWEGRDSIIGRMIEVECMQLTPAGKFRHPRFLRYREDKDD